LSPPRSRGDERAAVRCEAHLRADRRRQRPSDSLDRDQVAIDETETLDRGVSGVQDEHPAVVFCDAPRRPADRRGLGQLEHRAVHDEDAHVVARNVRDEKMAPVAGQRDRSL